MEADGAEAIKLAQEAALKSAQLAKETYEKQLRAEHETVELQMEGNSIEQANFNIQLKSAKSKREKTENTVEKGHEGSLPDDAMNEEYDDEERLTTESFAPSQFLRKSKFHDQFEEEMVLGYEKLRQEITQAVDVQI